jgi:hypothetical protein
MVADITSDEYFARPCSQTLHMDLLFHGSARAGSRPTSA